MRILGLLLATLAITNVMAQNATDSFCVKYAKAVFNKNATTLNGTDEVNLITAVVGRVVVGCDNNVATQYGIPGVDPAGAFGAFKKSACNSPNPNFTAKTVINGLVSDTYNAAYFNGSAPNYNSVTGLQAPNSAAGIGLAPSIRFVNVTGFNVAANPSTTDANGLINHLVSFFGRDLGCSFYGKTGGIPTYGGNADMKAVHAGMNITQNVWGEFVNTFASTLVSFGVTQADINGTIVPYVQQFLLGSTTQICNDASCNCATVNGVTYTRNANNACVNPNTGGSTGGSTAGSTGGSTGTTTAPPAGNGTTSPPTKAAASTMETSVVTMVAIMAAVLLAFL